MAWDGGNELTDHRALAQSRHILAIRKNPVAFESNANTNGLLRRYLLKGANLSMHSHAHVGVSTMESSRRFAGASSLSEVREMIAVIF